MELTIYILGSLYIISSLFRFSHAYTHQLFHDYRFMKKYTYKIEEMIYSTIHSALILLLSGYALQENIFDLDYASKYKSISVSEPIKLTIGLSLAYFTLDLLKCIKHLNGIFVLHHICAIHLLAFSAYSLDKHPYEGYFVMAYLFLLECNTPFMNLGMFLKICNFDYNVYGSVWVLHLLSYTLCRLIMVPYITYYYYSYYGINYYQIPNLAIIYGGSCYWAYKQLCGIQKRLIQDH